MQHIVSLAGLSHCPICGRWMSSLSGRRVGATLTDHSVEGSACFLPLVIFAELTEPLSGYLAEYIAVELRGKCPHEGQVTILLVEMGGFHHLRAPDFSRRHDKTNKASDAVLSARSAVSDEAWSPAPNENTARLRQHALHLLATSGYPISSLQPL